MNAAGRRIAPLLRLVGLVSLLATLLVAPGRARAGAASADLAEAMRGVAQATPEAVAAMVITLGSVDDPRALSVLEALRDGRLVVDDAGRAYIQDARDAALHDAVTGANATASPVHALAVDNAVRRILGPVLARLELRAPDPAVRLAAAEDLARGGETEAAPALRAAMAREETVSVRAALARALAQIDLASDDPELRLAAVAELARSGGMSQRSRLEALVAKGADGTFAERDPRVRAAADGALRALERRQAFVGATANVLYGLSTGSILLLTALGLAITFGLMGVINMAHGEMLMLGAYATYATQLFFRAYLPSYVSLYLVAAVPFAFVACSAAGAVLERSVIRFLYGRPLETLLATWGLSLILIQTVRNVFGAQNVTVENPPWLSGGVEIFEGVVLPYSRIAVVAFAVVVVAFVGYVLGRTPLGLRVRAVTQNRSMAACMGISTARVDTWTFALGSGVGGLGGVALSQLGNVGPELGQAYLVDSFMVVVLGGVGKLVGSVVAAFGLGIVQKELEPFAGAVLGKIVVLLCIVLVIQRRPQGLFASRSRAAAAEA